MMAHANLLISFLGDALLTTTCILDRVPRKSISIAPYELWFSQKSFKDQLSMGSAGYVHNPTHKYRKLGTKATKIMFTRYLKHCEGYVTYEEHPNRDMMEIDSLNVDFLEDDFPRIGKTKKGVKLYELQ